MTRIIAASIATLALCACGGERNDQPSTDDGISYSVETEDGSYRAATPEEAAEIEQMALEAYQNLLDERPAAEIAEALNSYWRADGRAASYDTSPYGYRITEGEMHKLGDSAEADGIKAASGFLAEAEAPFFGTVMTTYATFDDKAAANAYFERLSRDMTGVAGSYRSFDVAKKGYPAFSLRCVYVTETGNSVNCHYKNPDDRVIGVLFFAPGPPLEFTGEKEAIDLILENEQAFKRIGAAAGASWAYLIDAYND